MARAFVDSPRKLLFLDRDGTLIEDVGYPRDPARVRLFPEAMDAIKILVAHGYFPIIISNQSGVGRGIISPEQAEMVHVEFVKQFHEATGILPPCFYCFHAPEENCACRKPKPGLIIEARKFTGWSDQPGVMIGDKVSDVLAGESANLRGFQLQNNWPAIAQKLLQEDHSC